MTFAASRRSFLREYFQNRERLAGECRPISLAIPPTERDITASRFRTPFAPSGINAVRTADGRSKPGIDAPLPPIDAPRPALTLPLIVPREEESGAPASDHARPSPSPGSQCSERTGEFAPGVAGHLASAARCANLQRRLLSMT